MDGAMTRCKVTRLLNERVCKFVLATPDRYGYRLFVWKDAITRAATESHKVFSQTQGVANKLLLQSPVSIHINVMLFDWLH